jgi:glycosyltransferase involved in cell wall biosynthesis
MKALARLVEEGHEARFLIAGRGDDDARLRQEARSMGIGSHVSFLGYVTESEKVDLFQQAWVNVYPSPKEGWGLANVEAAACGTPTVASDSPGLRESVSDGVSGYLVPHSDVGAWATRLQALLEGPELRHRLSVGAVSHAAGFSWDRAAQETEQSLVRVIQDRGGRA